MSFQAPSFAFGSAVSATGSAFSDAFESYRRAQYLVAGSAVAPNSEASDFEEEDEDDGDEEAGWTRRRRFIHEFDEEDEDDEYEGQRPVVRVQRPTDDAFVTSFDWDQEQDEPELESRLTPVMDFPRSPARSESWSRHSRPQRPRQDTIRPMGERAPLLARRKSEPQSIQLESDQIEQVDVKSYGLQDTPYLTPPPPALNHKTSNISQKSQKSVHYTYVGKSTYGQTLFNSIAILLGIGMLSEPLAFAYAGWTMGTIIVISYAYISCYTAKILARMILVDPRLRSYSDIGRKAFGPKATVLISGMFCLELFAVTVILVTLYGDSIHALIPTHSVSTYKVWILVVLIPTVFLPLSLLSYTSILGIVSTLLLVVVILYDGVSKKAAPGSLLDPMPTRMGVQDLNKLGIAFGLFMAGFSGHPVIPSLARDMIDPTQFDSMINWAFGIATVIYMAIGSAGYLMFGENVHDEISVDLLVTPGFSPFINKVCLWLLVISPISKFGLNSQPLNTTIDILLGIDHNSMSSPEELAAKPNDMSTIAPHGRALLFKKIVAIIQRIGLTCLSVFVSISIPEFSSMMAFLGSFSAFMLAIVGPVAAKVTVERRCGVLDAVIMLAGVVMAVWGTAAAFWSAS